MMAIPRESRSEPETPGANTESQAKEAVQKYIMTTNPFADERTLREEVNSHFPDLKVPRKVRHIRVKQYNIILILLTPFAGSGCG